MSKKIDHHEKMLGILDMSPAFNYELAEKLDVDVSKIDEIYRDCVEAGVEIYSANKDSVKGRIVDLKKSLKIYYLKGDKERAIYLFRKKAWNVAFA